MFWSVAARYATPGLELREEPDPPSAKPLLEIACTACSHVELCEKAERAVFCFVFWSAKILFSSPLFLSLTQGTVIRVFSIPEGQKLFEFRRGVKR